MALLQLSTHIFLFNKNAHHWWVKELNDPKQMSLQSMWPHWLPIDWLCVRYSNNLCSSLFYVHLYIYVQFIAVLESLTSLHMLLDLRCTLSMELELDCIMAGPGLSIFIGKATPASTANYDLSDLSLPNSLFFSLYFLNCCPSVQAVSKHYGVGVSSSGPPGTFLNST